MSRHTHCTPTQFTLQEFESVKRQLKEAKRNHNAALVSLRAEARQVSIKEQRALKSKFAEVSCHGNMTLQTSQ